MIWCTVWLSCGRISWYVYGCVGFVNLDYIFLCGISLKHIFQISIHGPVSNAPYYTWVTFKGTQCLLERKLSSCPWCYRVEPLLGYTVRPQLLTLKTFSVVVSHNYCHYSSNFIWILSILIWWIETIFSPFHKIGLALSIDTVQPMWCLFSLNITDNKCALIILKVCKFS